MITTAAVFCKVDVIKFQKRTPRILLSEEAYRAPHPNPVHAYGETYGEHREHLELNLDQHRRLKRYCEEMGLIYACSVWDLPAAREIITLDPDIIKVPSACNLHKELLMLLCRGFKKEVHLSLGMTTHEEEERIISLFEEFGRNGDLVIYSCTSGYPVEFDDVNLLEITRLKRRFRKRVKSIGLSGHHRGIAVDIAAYCLGAQWIERHYTLDRTWKGTDHAASLEPDGLRRLSRDLRAVGKALCAKPAEILPVEEVQREKLKKGQIKWTA